MTEARPLTALAKLAASGLALALPAAATGCGSAQKQYHRRNDVVLGRGRSAPAPKSRAQPRRAMSPLSSVT